MEARPCQIIEFFNGTKQMLIPLFQRTYEWKKEAWETLWNDILERYEHYDETTDASHFTGAIVTSPARSVPVGVNKTLVIDGQQRLTTVAILLCAIRSLLVESDPDSKQVRRITKLLLNEDEEGLDYYKILPTQSDRAGFEAILKSPDAASESPFKRAFSFFRSRLLGKDSDDRAIDLPRLLETVQTRITVVSIHLGDNDDPYLIFESLNAKGTPLNQADLVRNYILLRIPPNEQQAVYDAHWLPLQDRLSGNLPEFIRQYLVMERGEDVIKGNVYAVLKRQIAEVEPHHNVATQLARMTRFSSFYKHITEPDGVPEAQAELSRSLARLSRWELATSHPLLLKLYGLHADGRLSVTDFCTCIKMVESFAVRRAICGVQTNQLKRTFISLAKDVDPSRPLDALVRNLAGGQLGRRWPKDIEFDAAWVTYRAYSNPTDRCRFILESLEREHPHKEPASLEKVQIEHVLPQTPTPEWHRELGATTDSQREAWTHTIGNLTLTGYNPELSNMEFSRKKVIYKASHFVLNRYFEPIEKWDTDAIQARAKALLPLAKLLWPRPEFKDEPSAR